jgi:hypothetical protein
MADTYIDQQETLGYGAFAVKQIKALVVGVDPEFDDALHLVATRLGKVTKAMEKALEKAGTLESTTFSGAASAGKDPIATARELLGKLVKYAESRDDGEAIASDILGRETLTTIKRRRPSKLLHALENASRGVDKHKAALPEHAKWAADLSGAHSDLATLDSAVRTSRQARRAMTPEVAVARLKWLKVYGAAKLIVEGVLKLADLTDRMPDVFDDLAEVHRVAGVSDDAPAEPAGAPSELPP